LPGNQPPLGDSLPHARVIINPAAGAGRTARLYHGVLDCLRGQGITFDHDLTRAPGHGMDLARDAGREGYEMVVVVGGDGTIHEVVNGLESGQALGRMALGIVHTGAGGDYVRTLGLDLRPEESCRRLGLRRRKKFDLGLVEYTAGGKPARRIFVNFAGHGIDAAIVRATTGTFKKLGAKPAYYLGMLTSFIGYRNAEVALKLDGVARRGRYCTIILSIGKYGGGSMKVAPDADPADGLFDVVQIGDLSKPDLLYSFPRIYKGTHVTHPKVRISRAVEVEIAAERDWPLQADGELLGSAPARFSLLPGALTVMV
jgi:YegS/Rv2252/BmrU family lipid kinase